MALELKVKYKGVDCDYWRVKRIECTYYNGDIGANTFSTLIVALAVYVDRKAREADVGNFLFIKQYVFPHKLKVGTDSANHPIYEEYTPDDFVRSSIYTKLKELPEFDGAKDD